MTSSNNRPKNLLVCKQKQREIASDVHTSSSLQIGSCKRCGVCIRSEAKTLSCFAAGLRYTATHTHIKESHLELCLSAYPSVDGSGSRAAASIHRLRSRTGARSQARTLCGGTLLCCDHDLNGTHFLATERQLRCRPETYGRFALVPKGRRYRRHRQV